jgi:Trypsin-co-occurring domain 2
MELNELIGSALSELDASKRHEQKKNYLVEEVLLEVYFSKVEDYEGKLKLTIIEGSMNTTTNNYHKITVKLKPKSSRNSLVIRSE